MINLSNIKSNILDMIRHLTEINNVCINFAEDTNENNGEIVVQSIEDLHNKIEILDQHIENMLVEGMGGSSEEVEIPVKESNNGVELI